MLSLQHLNPHRAVPRFPQAAAPARGQGVNGPKTEGPVAVGDLRKQSGVFGG